MPFAFSIAILGLVQATLVALPAPVRLRLPIRMRNRWLALVLPGSVVVVIAGIALEPRLADWLTYLALVGVPPLAAFALSTTIKGARRALALAVIPLFVIACGALGSLPAEASALALSALACLALGSLIAGGVPARWIRLGIYTMALVDACLVGANLLQGPNDVLNAAQPVAGLPQLQFAQFGSAVIGFGDLFIAAILGALLAGRPTLQVRAALLAAPLILAFDLLFFLVPVLPATVPIALALATLELTQRQTPVGQRRRPAAIPLEPISERGLLRLAAHPPGCAQRAERPAPW